MTTDNSRSRSPSPPLEIHRTRSRSVSLSEKKAAQSTSEPAGKKKLKDGAVGRMESSFYRKMMPGWRCAVRELLVKSLEAEVDELVQLQVSSVKTGVSFVSRQLIPRSASRQAGELDSGITTLSRRVYWVLIRALPSVLSWHRFRKLMKVSEQAQFLHDLHSHLGMVRFPRSRSRVSSISQYHLRFAH